VSSLSLSLSSITAFLSTSTLFPLNELKVLNSLYKCLFCNLIKFNKYYIQRHLREKHKDLLEEIESLDLLSSYRVIAKGQGLEKNKYFFQVKSKDKGKQVVIEEESRSQEEEHQEEEEGDEEGNKEEEEEEVEEDFTKQAFLKDFFKKKDALFQGFNTFQIKHNKPLNSLDRKLKYVIYLNNKNLKSLSLQSSLCKEKDKPLLNILVLNLKELLYISLERSYYLNKLSLQSLNSF
jgi:hypothetical protein